MVTIYICKEVKNLLLYLSAGIPIDKQFGEKET